MKKIYVSGPYTDTQNNASDSFSRMVKQVKFGQMEPVSLYLSNGEIPSEDNRQRRFNLIRKCDTVILSAGWADSNVALEERRFAEHNGIKVLYYLNVSPMLVFRIKELHSLGKSYKEIADTVGRSETSVRTILNRH